MSKNTIGESISLFFTSLAYKNVTKPQRSWEELMKERTLQALKVYRNDEWTPVERILEENETLRCQLRAILAREALMDGNRKILSDELSQANRDRDVAYAAVRLCESDLRKARRELSAYRLKDRLPKPRVRGAAARA